MFLFQENDDEDDIDDGLTEQVRKRRAIIRLIGLCAKLFLLMFVWIFATIVLITKKPHELEEFCVSVEPLKVYSTDITNEPPRGEVEIDIGAGIDEELMENPDLVTENSSSVNVWLQYVDIDTRQTLWQSEKWTVYLLETETKQMIEYYNFFKVSPKESSTNVLQLAMNTTSKQIESLLTRLDVSPVDTSGGVIYAFLLLIFLYVLIIWDITDRTFAALLTSSASIGVLALMDARPSLKTILSWIDISTLMLLFGMMVLVGILSESGVFDYLAVVAYRQSKGHAWPLIFFLCCFTAIIACVLDNVTMVMLMVPVTIRLCEVMRLRTIEVLISIVIFSNLGGTITPVGDPPNVIIVSEPFVAKRGINFLSFTVHMLPGVLFSMLGTFGVLYLMLRNRIHMSEGEQRRKSLKVLNKEMAKVFATTEVEDQLREAISKRIDEIKAAHRNKNSSFLRPVPNFIDTLAELEVKHKIRNVPLLIKSSIAMGLAVLLFLLHSFPFMEAAILPWSAVLAALLLLILTNSNDLEVVLAKVEWSTLLFFAALFVLMEVLAQLGLILWIGEKTISVIVSVSREHQLTVAFSLLLWVCAITSAFVDNIPITTMMLRVVIALAKSTTLNLPIAPLIWALAFGSCFGGNGTLIGASANVVTAGLANQHGYRITFMDFFKFGFPVMIVSVVVCQIYLLIAHSLFSWH
ncbi:P protein-like [Drosophila willistoni]|uniref:P protein-like n=1 Tax=Drosophila willistoni TaxID=7260 RepID=UPI000C26C2C3|nr:P protein-like [Drosophila willistoni]